MKRSGCSMTQRRVDAHVVGHHVGGEADAAGRGAVAQVAPGVSPPSSSAMR